MRRELARRFVHQHPLDAGVLGPEVGDRALEGGVIQVYLSSEDAAKKVERQVRKSATALLLESRIGHEFDGIVTYDQHVVAFLELLRQPYTGCNPRGLLLARDKPLSKQLLSYHRIPSPQFAVFRRGIKLRLPRKIKYPLFVKSTTEDASLGISQASVVENDDQLTRRVAFIHEKLGTAAIVEQFIDGRELYVGVLGNQRLEVFPVWEMSFTQMPDNKWRIATERVKWSTKYQKRHGIMTDAAPLDASIAEHIQRIARRTLRERQRSFPT